MPFVSGFLPSTRAPLFHNGPWPPGTSFSISIPPLPTVTVDATRMGFCGGMSFLARDIFEAGTPQLRGTQSSRIPSALAGHLLTRLIQSFDGQPIISRWIGSTQALDHDTVVGGPGLFHRTVLECPGVMSEIDAGRLCPIGVVLVQSWAPWDVFANHVVLVWGYERSGDMLTLHTYDCNFQGADDIFIRLDISSPTPAKEITTNGTDGPASGRIRGFFQLPYTHADPSPAYIDDAVTSVLVAPPPQMTPGSRATVGVRATNTGSTTWTRAEGYRLGGQPQDSTTWGIGRVELPSSPVDPQQRADFGFQITAPAAAGQYSFSWRMVHELVRWFGTPSPAVPIGVGSPSPLCDQLHQQHLVLTGQLNEVQAEIDAIDWSDPILARQEAARLARQAQALQTQIASLEQQQQANGCVPG